MKKALKAVGSILALLLLVVAGTALYIHLSGLPRYPKPTIVLEVKATPERVERGARLAKMLCVGCHYDPETRVLSGKRMVDVPPPFGVVYSPNITSDPAHGIASWTDGEIAYLLRTGIRRDGRYTPPYMVKLPHASDEDILSIIAFLRSDDPLVAPNARPTRLPEVTFLAKALSRFVFKPFPYPSQAITAPDPSDSVAYGRYLADHLLDCFSCHSADFRTNDYFDPPRSQGFYGGGNAMLDANGRTVYTANLTPDRETGIGAWSEQQFVRALKAGFRPSGTPIVYPMQAYAEMTDAEAKAVYAYLKTLPPIRKTRPAAAAVAVDPGSSKGKQVYYKYACNSCHGDTGAGLYDLRRATLKYPTDAELQAFVLNPGAKVPGIQMPAWEGVIQADELAPLVEYVKTLQVPRS